MASFLEKMRAPNVYGGRNPFSPPEQDPFAMLDEFRSRFPEPRLQQIGQMGRDLNVGSAQPPMNTIFNQGIDPIEQAKLEQRRAEQEGRERISQNTLATREKLAGRDQEIRQQRANVYEFKARNPGSKFMQGKDGILRAVNPLTNEVTILGPTGMSDEELAELNQENAIARIQETGGQQRQTQELRGSQALEQIGARVAGQKDVKATPSAGDNYSPSKQKAKAQLNTSTLLNTKPEYRKFVKIGPDGMPRVEPVGTPNFFGFTSGPTKEQRDEIMTAIFGSPTGPAEEKPKVETTVDTTKETPEQRMARLKKAAGVK